MMIPEYASASLTNWIWGQAMPNHLFSLSTDAGQEDHVSMAANVALKAYSILPRLAEVVAIELAFAHQAAAIRKQAPVIPSRAPKHDATKAGEVMEWVPIKEPEKRTLNEVGETVLELIGRCFPTVTEDRSMAAQISKLAASVLEGEVISAVENKGDYFKDFV
jgi:histidine ammonia-lyase